MEKEEKLHKEIDLIQGCITRMANNSFMIKGWAITIVVALFAFFNSKEVSFILITATLLIMIICFWYLDAFFLQTEKKYRALYNRIIKDHENGEGKNFYELKPPIYENGTDDPIKNGITSKKIPCIARIMISKTLFIFFGMLLVFTAVYFGSSLYLSKRTFPSIDKSNITESIITINKELDQIQIDLGGLTTSAEVQLTNLKSTKEYLEKTQNRTLEIQKEIQNLMQKLE